jgi:ribose transport system ATP-binding protein
MSSKSIDNHCLVKLSKVDKYFGKLQAIKDISVIVGPGECVGLVGHNGAGKSTLIKIINGRLKPSTGLVTYHGSSEQANANDVQARSIGIRSVFQELSLCPNLTVLENWRIPYRGMARSHWRSVARDRITAELDRVFPNHGINPKATVADLTIAERQMVEIAIAFSKRDKPASLVILDEPTSSLDAGIARQLIDYIGIFCTAGGAVIFITHMLGEIFDVSSRIIVMKDGRVIEDGSVNEFTKQSLVDAMGHVVSDQGVSATRAERILGDVVIKLPSGLTARRREIVGLAGLAGHGQAQALASYYLSNTSRWKAPSEPAVVFIAGDRARDGIMPLWSILRNLSLKTLKEFSKKLFVNQAAEENLAQDWKNKIGIRTNNLDNSIMSLSGGNQQKVLFANALASSAPIVVMDDPMRGVDVGTKKEVYEMVKREAANGRTFLWYSTETEEICECDRVFVYRDGRISAELIGSEITEDNILKASFAMQDHAA